MLVDIHTHHAAFKKNLSFVVGVHSLGIHPWELTTQFSEAIYFQKFLELKNKFNSNILAIGECGLDRRRQGIVDINLQEKVLGWQMDWAILVQRPLIIHCVKAYADLLKILKARKFSGRILIHDFSGNFTTAQSLLKFDCYFSFGKSLFNNKLAAASVLKSLPKEKIFLETDDQLDFSIGDIYQKAGFYLGLDEKKCEELFYLNLLNFFSNQNDISSTDVVDILCAPIGS
jgi:TatD DNase family protein